MEAFGHLATVFTICCWELKHYFQNRDILLTLAWDEKFDYGWSYQKTLFSVPSDSFSLYSKQIGRMTMGQTSSLSRLYNWEGLLLSDDVPPIHFP